MRKLPDGLPEPCQAEPARKVLTKEAGQILWPIGATGTTACVRLREYGKELVHVGRPFSPVCTSRWRRLEKAVVAELLPREQRSLGLGILASVNALGDFASSVFVGVLLAAGSHAIAFGTLAIAGGLGVLWMAILVARRIL